MPDPAHTVEVVTLTRAELYGLLHEAAQRGAEIALAKATRSTRPAPSALLSRAEAVQLLGVSIGKLDRLIADEGLPFVRVGAHRKFNADAVLAWVDQQETGS